MPEDVGEGAFKAAIDANRGSWLPNDRFRGPHGPRGGLRRRRTYDAGGARGVRIVV